MLLLARSLYAIARVDYVPASCTSAHALLGSFRFHRITLIIQVCMLFTVVACCIISCEPPGGLLQVPASFIVHDLMR